MEDASLSLYFGLKDGERAELEVVARAAIEWATSVRIAAGIIEPRSSIQINIVSADEGSIRINTILDWTEEQLAKIQEGAGRRPRITALALGLSVFVLVDAGPTYEYWLGEEEKLELSQEDREAIDGLMERISESEEVKKANRKFFSELEKDPSIRSVGISPGRDEPLVFSLPSSKFSERTGLWELQIEEPEGRPAEKEDEVILRRAVLENAPRKWRFTSSTTGQDFSALMQDEKFLNDLEAGTVEQNIRIGIGMKIRMKFKEVWDGENWIPVDGSWVVTRVISIG